MPLDQELIRKHALIVQTLHKGIQKLLLRLVSLHEVEHDCLQQTIDSNLAIGLDQPQECGLVQGPRLNNIALFGEELILSSFPS